MGRDTRDASGGWVRVQSLAAYLDRLERTWERDAAHTRAAVLARRDEDRNAKDWQDVATAYAGAEEVAAALREVRRWVADNSVAAVALQIPEGGLRRSGH